MRNLGRSGAGWSDYEYEPGAAGELIRDDGAIASATMGQIKTMPTYCARGERFCDGHWGAMICEGRIAAILRMFSGIHRVDTTTNAMHGLWGL